MAAQTPRVQLERLLAHQAGARTLYSTVHDLTGLAYDLHARESTPADSRQRRNPILRLQACGLALRLRERLELSLHALEVEERGGQGGMTPGRWWSQSGSSDMVAFLCKGTDAANKFSPAARRSCPLSDPLKGTCELTPALSVQATRCNKTRPCGKLGLSWSALQASFSYARRIRSSVASSGWERLL